mmetsp:Transcript_12497/g.27127  ORF Transcript_12497/g.27127 Transcript_12497/m.27127 type:complete len:359 (-) Transcript_12497:214-1290(-)
MIDGKPRYSSPTIFAALFIFNAASSIPTSTSRAVPIASFIDLSLSPLNDLISFNASMFPRDVVICFNFSAFSLASPHNDLELTTSVRLFTMTSLACESALHNVLNFPAAPWNSSTILSMTRLHPSANCLIYLLRPIAFNILPSLTFDSTADASMLEMASVMLLTSVANFCIIWKMRWHNLLLSLMASKAFFPASMAVSKFKFSIASMQRDNSCASSSIPLAISRSSEVNSSVIDCCAFFSMKLSIISGRASTLFSKDCTIRIDREMHSVDFSFMVTANSSASFVLSPSIKSAITANDSASRSVAAPTSERWMDSPHRTRFLPVARVDVQSSTVCLAALWHCLMLWMMELELFPERDWG